MSKKPDTTGRGIKFLFIALPMFFVGPSVIYNAFQNQHTVWHYLVLAVGIALCAGAMYFCFKGLNIVVRGLFDRDRARNHENQG